MHALRKWKLGLAALAALAGAPASAAAQIVVACDFDIADDLGRYMYGRTLHLVGRAGASTDPGQFYLINGNSADTDVDKDGFSTACNYNNLFIALRGNLVNQANPSLAIAGDNIVITRFPTSLAAGQSAQVNVAVELPSGTVAGTYVGTVVVRDSVNNVVFSPTGDILNRDEFQVEVRVVEERALSVLEAETATPLDSLVIRGRAGQRASAVLRLANAGNTPLGDVRLSATDLRSESAVGLVIPGQNVTFSAPSFSGIGVGDTARVTVTVAIPRGILNGRYRGTIFAQAEGAAPVQIPLIVIVTSSRGILFANNPVRGVSGDIAQIAFNGDPGTGFRVGIFDMAGLLVFQVDGTVFAGTAPVGGGPLSGGDFAVNVGWPLRNGRGEDVASGMYLVVVQSVVNGERQFAKDRLMVIR